MMKSKDIVFTEIDASRVHYPYEDALVITAKIANSPIHWVLIDSGSVVNIFYWSAYQNIGLKGANLSPMTLPLYRFTGESVTPKGTIMLVITLGETPQTVTMVILPYYLICLASPAKDS